MSGRISVGISIPPFTVTFQIDPTVIAKRVAKITGLSRRQVDLADLLGALLTDVLASRYEEGHSAGGWGKDYKERWFKEMNPGTPVDLQPNADSITWTAVALDGLRSFYENSRGVTRNDESRINRVFEDARVYLKARSSADGAGLLVGGAAGDVAMAIRLRHTATASLAWLRAEGGNGQFHQLLAAVLHILGSGYSFNNDRAFTIGCVLGSLYVVRRIRHVQPQVSIADSKLQGLIGMAESALLARFDQRGCLWDLEPDQPKHITLWYALWILKFGFDIGRSANSDVSAMYQKVVERIVNERIQEFDDVEAVAFFDDGVPNAGATSLLLESLRYGPLAKDKATKRHIQKLSRFLAQFRPSGPAPGAYSWCTANVISALLGSSPWGLPELKS